MSDAGRTVANLTDERFEANIGGVGLSVKTSMLTGFMNGLRNVPGSVWFAVALMLAIMLGITVFGAWYVAGHAIPMALGIINEGHAARDANHSKDLDKVIAAFKESNSEQQKHNKEMIDVLERRLTPIAVNPLGGGS